MTVIDEVNENRTCEVSVRNKLEIPEKQAPPDANGDLSNYVFDGEGQEEGEITEMVQRSQREENSIEKDITFNKKGLIKFIEKQFRENEEDE